MPTRCSYYVALSDHALLWDLFMAVYTPSALVRGRATDRSGRPILASFSVYFLASLGADGAALVRSVLLSYSTVANAGGRSRLPRDSALPFLSILAPAYCEAAGVKDAMSALVRLDYPAYEVIFVDDGSSDDTYDLRSPLRGLIAPQHGRCDVRVFTKPNRGKWSAHDSV